jgi:hypothetical protein
LSDTYATIAADVIAKYGPTEALAITDRLHAAAVARCHPIAEHLANMRVAIALLLLTVH